MLRLSLMIGVEIALGCAAQRLASAQQPALRPYRVTLAQVASSSNLSQNLVTAEKVLRQASRERADWALFPELFLTGTYNGNKFRQSEAAAAFEQIRQLCRELHVAGLIGTGWIEEGRTYNQIRIVDADGEVTGVYAKTCLTRGDAVDFSPGPLQRLHQLSGMTVGTLICNDLWVTPGFSDGPDPHLSWQLAQDGAQIVFHAIGSGSDQRYRSYHESNLLLRAAEARCPIVAVNGYRESKVNCASGVVGTDFSYLIALPDDREVVQTVEVAPAAKDRSLE